MLIVTSSVDVGTLSVFQFATESQLLSPAPPVHVMAESSVLGSIHSIRGRHDFDRFELPVRCRPDRNLIMAISPNASADVERA